MGLRYLTINGGECIWHIPDVARALVFVFISKVPRVFISSCYNDFTGSASRKLQ